MAERIVAVVIDEAHCLSKWLVFLYLHVYVCVSIFKCDDLFLNNINQTLRHINNCHFTHIGICRSKDFRAEYGKLHELRALVPHETPFIACTATATRSIKKEVISLLVLRCVIVNL